MSFAFNPFTGTFDIVSDLSGYVPYTGATSDVDLGANKLIAGSTHQAVIGDDAATKAGNFTDGTNTTALADTSYAVNATGNTYFNGSMGIGMTPTSAMLGVNYGTAFTRLGDGSTIAGVFENGSNIVNVAATGNALEVTGNSVFNSYIQTIGIIVNETSPVDNSNALDVNGSGGFYNGSLSAKFSDGSNNRAGNLSDGTNTVDLCNSTYSIDAVGNADITGALNLLDSSSALIIGDIGGDARGVGSIDIQQSRTASTQVASGENAIAFGRNNTASSKNAVTVGEDNSVNTSVTYYDDNQQQGIAIGKSNSVSGTASYEAAFPIAIGRSNTITGSAYYTPFVPIAIGRSNTMSVSSGVTIGDSNTISGAGSLALGVSNTCVATNSAAIGRICYSGASAAFALGILCRAMSSASTCIGSNSRALGSSATTIGSSIVNWYNSTLMAGTSTAYLILNSVGLSFTGNENPTEKIHSTGNILASNITSLGAEKITNGTFTGSATGWTVGSFAYNANTVRKTADGTTALTQTSAAMVTPLVAGEYYLLSFVLNTLTAGSITISCGGVTIATLTVTDSAYPSQTFSYVFKATSTANLSFAPSNTSRVTALDTISLKKITGGDLIGLGSLYLGQDDTNRMQASVSSTGLVTFNANGSAAEFLFSDRTRYPGTFAEIYVADSVTAQTIATGTTYVKLTSFTTNGQSSNATADQANDKITLTKAGKYLVTGMIDFSLGTANVQVDLAVFAGGTKQSNLQSYIEAKTINEDQALTVTGLLSVAANTDVDLRVRHDDAGSVNITVENANLTITYVGE